MKKIAGLMLAAGMLVVQPAWAMESQTFAGDTPEVEAVVSVRVDDSDPEEGVCTGTAIAPHWVLTARHCVEAAKKPGGSVRAGQGEMQFNYQIDRWEVAPRGDIALAHTVEEMQIGRFAEVAEEVPSGEVNVYGWSSDGSGGTTKLPSAKGEVRGESPLALFEAPTALDVALQDGARIQPGDSGGAVFSGGKAAGVMSAGLFEDPDNPTEEEMTSNAAVAVAPVADQVEWIRGLLSKPEKTPEERMPASDGPRASGFTMAGVAVGLLIAVAAGWVVLSRRKA
ncbi:trypsin-like serine protease [Corynebacterium jeddahense]|nr:trypsin-like serine protease [Corynebacterium jeddahense]